MAERLKHEAHIHLGNADLTWDGYREVRFWAPWMGPRLPWGPTPPRWLSHGWRPAHRGVFRFWRRLGSKRRRQWERRELRREEAR